VRPRVEPTFVLTRFGPDAEWTAGRADMLYRDLVPDRQGGAVIASHIRIPRGGEVGDWVHFHRVAFQMIHCYRGWVRVVYEDQGPPFVLQAGDCVLQPPEIRHRVLECSPGLEVVEVTCPAEHVTEADPGLELPTPEQRPGRLFGGQRFVRHEAARASWEPWRVAGFECRDTGIGAATEGLAGVRVVRPAGEPGTDSALHGPALQFLFVLDGRPTLRAAGRDHEALAAGDTLVVPPGMAHSFRDCSGDLQLLDVTLPAEF